MALTNIRGKQIQDGTVQRADLDTSTIGQAVVAKIVQGTNISLSSTGGDSGTGDVTISSPTVVSTDSGNQATIGSDSRIYVPDPTPKITSVRLRSFNSVGNPSMSVDQRMTGGFLPTNGVQWVMDRWLAYNNTGVSPYCAPATSQAVKLPGSNFRITDSIMNLDIASTSKPSLAAGDKLVVQQTIEGPMMRELIDDVHSVSILAQTNVSGGLKFSLWLQDSAGTRSLVKLCTIPTANTWTLIQLPNIPVWSSGGSWNVTAGNVGYYLGICVAAGSSAMASANDTWQNASVVGAIGMDNILSKPNSSRLQVAFIQHEAGSQSTTLIDKPFTGAGGSYDECLRYYCKSYSLGVAPGTANALFSQYYKADPTNSAYVLGPTTFPRPMAVTPPNVYFWSPSGVAQQLTLFGSSTNALPSALVSLSEKGFQGLQLSAAVTANTGWQAHYAADSGW